MQAAHWNLWTFWNWGVFRPQNPPIDGPGHWYQFTLHAFGTKSPKHYCKCVANNMNFNSTLTIWMPPACKRTTCHVTETAVSKLCLIPKNDSVIAWTNRLVKDRFRKYRDRSKRDTKLAPWKTVIDVVTKLSGQIDNGTGNFILPPPHEVQAVALRDGDFLMFVCSFVCSSACCLKGVRFSQKLNTLELWYLLTTNRKSQIGFSKNAVLDP